MDTIATDNPFSPAQTETLTTLVRMLIPASAKYFAPGADDPEILADIISTARQHPEVLAAGLDEVNAHTSAVHEAPLAALAPEQATAVAQTLQETSPEFLHALVAITVQCYYRNPRVMQSLNMEPRPPYPQGYELAQGDWAILDPVKARGKVWRDAN